MRGRPKIWPAERDEALRALWAQGLKENEIAAAMGTTRGSISGRGRMLSLHFGGTEAKGGAPLRRDHPALAKMETIFPKARQTARDSFKLLKPGTDQRKLGGRVTKGRWAGMPIFSLTLEERATCSPTCPQLRWCYGNTMPHAKRTQEGQHLEARLEQELYHLNRKHPRGFVVRLHILGDFYSLGYVARWHRWILRYPALHVFGYTQRPLADPIGDAVIRLRKSAWSQFAIRHSHTEAGPGRTIVVETAQDAARAGAILCPAQTGATASCATCGLCWARAAFPRTIAFLRHGMMAGRHAR